MFGGAVVGLTSRLAQKNTFVRWLGEQNEKPVTSIGVQCKRTIHVVLRPEAAAAEFSPGGTTLLGL